MAERFRNDVWPVAARQLGESLQSNEDLQSNKRLGNRQRSKKGLVQQEKQLPVVDDALSLSTLKENPGLRWSESERALVISILQCLSYVIGNEECGKALYTILAPVGKVLLPFVDIDDPNVVDLAMETVKNILSIDCDIMLRSLLELSGQGLPSPPLPSRKKQFSSSKQVTRTSNRSSTSCAHVVAIHKNRTEECRTSGISKRCLELLAFIEALPEQALL